MLDEINAKHVRVRDLIAELGVDALWLRQPHNIAWFTAGMDAQVDISATTGVYSLLITPEQRRIYTDNIEITRLRDEENVESLGFDLHESRWYAPDTPDSAVLISDTNPEVEARLQQMRWVLTPEEQTRYRALGADTSAALEATVRAIKPGDTEYEIAARLSAACLERGGVAIVNLVGTDERISAFRHPLPTEKRVDRSAMVVVCMRRGGLVTAATRFVHFGAISPELDAKQYTVAAISAKSIYASTPGRTLSDVLLDIQHAYAENNEPDQWQHHHQGGLIGYLSRERVAQPDDTTIIQAGHALAWNPSIVGMKSEDTILVGADGAEVITPMSDSWARISVDIAGQTIERPAILVK